MQQGVEEEKITVVTLVTCPEAADGFCKVHLRVDCFHCLESNQLTFVFGLRHR